MNDQERAERRSAAARKAAATRKANAERRRREWEDRGKHEHTVERLRAELARKHGNVVVAEPAGPAVVCRNRDGEPALTVGTLRVSLERATFTPTVGLHPASMAFALRVVDELLGRSFRFGDWRARGWRKSTFLDEHGAECYELVIIRPILEDQGEPVNGQTFWNAGDLLDVDPIDALLT